MSRVLEESRRDGRVQPATLVAGQTAPEIASPVGTAEREVSLAMAFPQDLIFMRTIDADEAKKRLCHLLERVEQGESFTIEKDGVPVAILQPVTVPIRRPLHEVIAEMREFQAVLTLGDMTARDLINYGRR